MVFKKFIQDVCGQLFSLECKIDKKTRFSQKEINEILANAKQSNLKYFERLSKMNELNYFDVSYLMISVELDETNIALIENACTMFNENEFKGHGQTLSDFIFRVSANIAYLNEANLDVFKEIVQCKNEIYDFSTVMQNPIKAKAKKTCKEYVYAIENVFKE